MTIASILLRVFCVANLQKLLSRQAGGNRPGLHVKICLQLVGRRLQTVLQISLVTDEVERKVPVDTFLPKGLRNLQVGENGLEAENDVVVPGTEARRGIELFVGLIEDMKAVQVHELVVFGQHSLESLAKAFLAHVFRDEKVASFANCWIGRKFAGTWPHELATHRTSFHGARLVGILFRRLALSRITLVLTDDGKVYNCSNHPRKKLCKLMHGMPGRQAFGCRAHHRTSLRKTTTTLRTQRQWTHLLAVKLN